MRTYFRITWEILFSPARFFENARLEGGVFFPVLYALSLHGIAAWGSYTWKQALNIPLHKYLADLGLIIQDAHEMGFPEGREERGQVFWETLLKLKQSALTWFWQSSSIWLAPLKALASLGWATLILYIGALLLLPRAHRPLVSWRGSLRLASFTTVPVLWGLIPVVGPLIHHTMAFATTWISLKNTYKISDLRAGLIALFPLLLFLGILFLGLGILGFMAFQVFGPWFS